MSWDAITNVCVVEDKNNVPSGYEVISSTTDNGDADLWKDKKMRKKITRYLAFTRERSMGGEDKVLADITVSKEDQVTPAGYTCIPHTHYSKEAVLKKKSLIIRLVNRSLTNEAITDIYLTSGKSRSKPVESTARAWEIKDLALFVRYGPILQTPVNNVPKVADLPYQYPARSNSLNEQLPAPLPRKAADITRQGTFRSPEQVAHMSGLDDVPFQLNPILLALATPDTISVPALQLKTREEILRAYQYDFSTENLVKRQAEYTS
ncbi:multivesicular body subunit 12B-like [Apostichopus japonicus]|uniref:multivesicular body subunit 12B-like n=1 Tax=Stichopus japonicus TaxID=307972 RepID=UPI003AB5B35F